LALADAQLCFYGARPVDVFFFVFVAGTSPVNNAIIIVVESRTNFTAICAKSDLLDGLATVRARADTAHVRCVATPKQPPPASAEAIKF
jgi:hypothetical protein